MPVNDTSVNEVLVKEIQAKEKNYTIKALKKANSIAYTANKKAYLGYIFPCS